MAIDMRKFHQAFYEDSFDGLNTVESELLAVDISNPDPETIGTIFRMMHSIKGGAATFGFSQVSEFAHVMETLLDKVRDKALPLSKELVDLLLKSVDMLRECMNGAKDEIDIDLKKYDVLMQILEDALTGKIISFEQALKNVSSKTINNSELEILSGVHGTINQPKPNTSALKDKNVAGWIIQFYPHKNILLTGNEPILIFRQLRKLGEIKVTAHVERVPDFGDLNPEEIYIHWTIELLNNVIEQEVRKAFEWVEDVADLVIKPIALNVGAPISETVTVSSTTQGLSAKELEIEEAQRKILEQKFNSKIFAAEIESTKNPIAVPAPIAITPPIVNVTAVGSSVETLPSKSSAGKESASIRVDIAKVDNLVNLVGELVITHSLIKNLVVKDLVKEQENAVLIEAVAQLDRNIREIQDGIMGIRMLPISMLFGTIPRIVHDLSARLGKKINLKLLGEQTELDRSLMENLKDPLMHLVRNAIDHGLEVPEKRKAVGKNEIGTITLNAYHRGGNVLIEISDDGRGIDCDALLKKALEKGTVARGTILSRSEARDLIFTAGLSTAEKVTDISGRGVGMDVVKENIHKLHGSVAVTSVDGKGTTFVIRLPLTLAILDGQLVKIGESIYIIPIASIIETVKIIPENVNVIAGDIEILHLRNEHIPILRPKNVFHLNEGENEKLDDKLLVIVEGDKRKIGILIDDVFAQQQVVIKNLDANYQRVRGISGASTLGDGSVALIIDLQNFIKLAGFDKEGDDKK